MIEFTVMGVLIAFALFLVYRRLKADQRDGDD